MNFFYEQVTTGSKIEREKERESFSKASSFRSILSSRYERKRSNRWHDPSTEDWRSPIRRRNGISASRVFPTRKNKGEGKKVVRNSAPYAQWPFHPASFPSLPFQEHSALPCRRGEIQIYAPTAPGVFFELMKNESSRQRSRLHPPSPSPQTTLCSQVSFLLRLLHASPLSSKALKSF